MVNRRQILAGAAVCLAAPRLALAQPVQITDVLGNRVDLPRTPERIVLLDATDYFSVSALVPDPFARIAGWASRARLDLEGTSLLSGIDMPEVGGIAPDSISPEAILALDPDLVVASAYMLPPGQSSLETALADLSIPLMWSGGYDGALAPDRKLVRAMEFWGKVLGVPERAQAVVNFANTRYDAIRACVANGPRPRTYMEIQTTYDSCCWAAGRAYFGDLFDIAGGELLAGSDGWGAQLSEEGLIALAPEVYIASGGNFAPMRQPSIGPGLDPDEGRKGLAKAADRLALRKTPAVKSGRVHGIWTGLITSPLLTPILAEYLALWLHPERCSSLSPGATLGRINEFLADPIPGPLGLSLAES